MSSNSQIERAFYNQSTRTVARELLGQRLVLLNEDNRRLSGFITEVEAYVGTKDLACHARVGKTKRNATMWGPPGYAYVYFTYGVHWMLNFVTEEQGFPAAVLLRGIWPTEGLEVMLENRPVPKYKNLTNGPAKLSQALGIDGSWDGVDLCSEESLLFVEEGTLINDDQVTRGPRVGLNSVPEPWKSKPWRFLVDPTIFMNGETIK